MTRWYPTLRRLPARLRATLAQTDLAGHPRAVGWLDRLIKDANAKGGMLDSHPSEELLIRVGLVAPALRGLSEKIEADLVLQTLLSRLPPAVSSLLGECTGLKRPVPLDVLQGLGHQASAVEVLRYHGLLTRFASRDDAWALHPFVREAATHLPGGALCWTSEGRAHDMGHLANAESFHLESIKLKQEVYGRRDHEEVATSLHGLGNVLTSQDRYTAVSLSRTRDAGPPASYRSHGSLPCGSDCDSGWSIPP